MGIIYNGAHSITFTRLKDNKERKSWKDFGLVPSSKHYIQPPKPQFDYAPLTRSAAILDLSMALRKTFGYEGTEGQWEFYIDHDKWSSWNHAYQAFEEYFDGTLFSVMFDDVYGWVYTGVISIASYTPDAEFSKLTLSYNLNWLMDSDIMPDWYGNPYPKYLEIYQEPEKMTYDQDEEIDYTGLVVRLLTATKSLFTDVAHPDGIIPNEELIFDKTTASWEDNKNGIMISWNSTYNNETLLTFLKIKVNVPPYATKIAVVECPIPGQVTGDPVTLDGSIIKAYRIDGSLYEDPNYPDSIVPLGEITYTPDTIQNETGSQTIKLSWTEPIKNKVLTCNYKVKVYDGDLYGIKVTTLPNKLDYTAMEDITYSGMVVKRVKINYRDYVDEYYPDAVIPRSELITKDIVTTPYKIAIKQGSYSYIYKDETRYKGYVTSEEQFVSGKELNQKIYILWRSEYYNDSNQYFLDSFILNVTGPYVRTAILYASRHTSRYPSTMLAEIVDDNGVTKLKYLESSVEKYIAEDTGSFFDSDGEFVEKMFPTFGSEKIVSSVFYYPNGAFSDLSYKDTFNLSIMWGSDDYNVSDAHDIYCKAALLNKSSGKYIKNVYIKVGELSTRAYDPVQITITNKKRIYDGVLDFLYYDEKEKHSSSNGILYMYFEGSKTSYESYESLGYYVIISRKT